MPRHAVVPALALALALALATAVYAAGDLAQARAAFEREDYAKAYALYAPLAAQADPEAQYRVGLMLKFGWGVDKDLAAAARSFRQAGEKGHAESQAELGRLYKDGRGVTEDAAEAARWLRRAADAGVGIAQLNLGRLYKDGSGVPRDLAEAYAWFTLAAANGYMDGMSYRTRLQQEMTPEQVREGERLAAERAGRSTQMREKK
ncbi:MAG TPA: tetratricopeptide repeat protein [Burkholderiaceae bacterium]|nr:tetratricopeptide repeat protein [Burkholderiaceae bacterium]